MIQKVCKGTFVLASISLLCAAIPAVAQESAARTWGSSLTFGSPNERIVDLQEAEANERARRSGYGPGATNVTNNYNGEVTSNTTNNGSVSSTSSTNAINLTTNSSSVTNGTGTVGVTYHTGATSHVATQQAVAQNAQSDNGNVSNAAD